MEDTIRKELEWPASKCGKTRHNEANCPTKTADVDDLMIINDQLKKASLDVIPKSTEKQPEEVQDFGSWMLVKKPVRKKTSKAGLIGSGDRENLFEQCTGNWESR